MDQTHHCSLCVSPFLVLIFVFVLVIIRILILFLNVILILILILCFSEHRKVSQRVLDGALSLKESIAVANVLYSIL